MQDSGKIQYEDVHGIRKWILPNRQFAESKTTKPSGLVPHISTFCWVVFGTLHLSVMTSGFLLPISDLATFELSGGNFNLLLIYGPIAAFVVFEILLIVTNLLLRYLPACYQIRIVNNQLQTTEQIGWFRFSKTVDIESINELLIKSRWRLRRRIFFSRTFAYPDLQPALVALCDNREILIAYGYPDFLISELGKQVSIQIEKRLAKNGTILKTDAGPVDLKFDRTSDPIQKIGSKIKFWEKGKQRIYEFRPFFLAPSVLPPALFAIFTSIVIGWIAVQYMFHTEALMLLVAMVLMVPFAICVGALIWLLDYGRQSVRFAIEGDLLTVEERSLLFKDSYQVNSKELQRVSVSTANVSSPLRDASVATDIDVVTCLRLRLRGRDDVFTLNTSDDDDLDWLSFRLNIELLGYDPAKKAASKEPEKKLKQAV